MRNYLTLLASIIALLLFVSYSSYAQEERQDTIKASIISANKARNMAGNHMLKPVDFKYMVTAMGTGDVIKYIQMLPGVSTGAEGSSAIYVRGGNLGGNLITLDGIPIYGSTHLLGFTSVYSPEIVSDMDFYVGGFPAEEGNFTASHINIKSANGDMEKLRASISLSNFLLGGTVSMPIIRNKLSLVTSLRVSPIGAEFRAIKGLSNAMDSLSNINAIVYDAYAKLKYQISDRHEASLSVFNSLDSYGYSYGATSDERMRWANLIVNGKYNFHISPNQKLRTSISYNKFKSYQGMQKVMEGQVNNLAISNPLEEWTLQLAYDKNLRPSLDFQGGIKARLGEFAPGSVVTYRGGLLETISQDGYADITNTLLLSAHLQLEYKKPEKFHFRASGRYNYFNSKCLTIAKDGRSFTNPEFSFLARANVTKIFGFEATYDWTTQYYHTLEGIPLGWSLDMIVPSNAACKPESAIQYYIGSFLSTKGHSVSLGAYYKDMLNLLYCEDASQLFSTNALAWRDGIQIGTGRSYGMEFLYDISLTRFNGKIAYTLSKTDRLFKEINNGERFPAKFDRRHILNVNAQYLVSKSETKEFGLSAFFTYQSGHHINIAAWEYIASLLPNGEEKVPIQYHASENALQLAPYIRMDLGCFIKWGKQSRHPSTLNLGIYNVFNRHNAYSITYDTNERKWKQLSLLPIMPSFSWTMEF